MEFKSNTPPSKNKILSFLEVVKEPVRFETTANLKIIFALTQHARLSYQDQTAAAIKILSAYLTAKS
jgi:hypothetical protein